jgi:hypothetical protein
MATMNKAQKNRAQKKRKARSPAKTEEKVELEEPNPFVKSVSVESDAQVLSPEMKKEYRKTALDEAQKLWNAIKKKAKDPKFVKMDDKKKIEMFSKEFHAFHKEFPIVSRYIICMGQYSRKAFTRYLIKVQNAKFPTTRDKGYMEDQWVRRQADYVRYLWEAYQRGHYNNSEAQAIWQESYQTLKKEFIDFRTLHENIEKDLEVGKKINKGELITELMKRLSSGDQSLDNRSMTELLEVMKIQLFQQRKEKLVAQIKNIVPVVEASCEAFGTCEPVEHVDLPIPEHIEFPKPAVSSMV